jgi:hypothetical protein
MEASLDGQTSNVDLVETPARAGGAVSEASRYYAAAAYSHGQFRQQVLKFVRHGFYRARTPEFGIDPAFIIRHCKLAERRALVRDALMLLAFLLVAHRPMAWLLSDPDEAAGIINYFQTNLFWGAFLAMLLLFAERLHTQYFIAARRFAPPAPESSNLVPTSPGGSQEEQQNLVVYGAYSPFVGSGYSVGSWSFSVNLERGKTTLGQIEEPKPFTPEALMDFAAGRIGRLRVRGLQQREVLFVDGQRARDYRADLYLNGQPRLIVDASTIRKLQDVPLSGARAYRCVMVPDWGGEIVVSVYFRCKKGESNLFVEACYFLLAPPKRDFFKVDESDPRIRVFPLVRLLGRSAVLAVPVLAMAGVHVCVAAAAPFAHWFERREINRGLRRNRRYNVGATTSIRELGMENYYRIYFQRLDKECHVKTTEQCLVDSIVEFLDQHCIDTSDLRDRASTILNNGVIVAGGELKAENMAVGQSAMASLARFGAKIGVGGGGAPPAAARQSS